MNASIIISDTMSLQEKLDAIDAALALARAQADDTTSDDDLAPTDPQDLLLCDGCQ